MNTKSKHYQKYDALVQEHPEVIERYLGDGTSYLGVSKERWQELYQEDEHLNSYPLKNFDANYIKGLKLTLAESVCLHKHIIRYYILEK